MLLLVLVLAGLRYPCLNGRRSDANISASTKKGTISFSCGCVYACVAPVLYTLVYCAYTCVVRVNHLDETREFASTRVGRERLVFI